MKRDIVLIAHNLRSCHNIGSLLRTADGLGVLKVYLTGYTPYPNAKNDERLPYLSAKIDKQISKTSLGAEKSVDWSHVEDISLVLEELRNQGYKIIALEQSDKSIDLDKFYAPDKIVLIMGREVEGIEPEILKAADTVVSIPMLGAKESFNVVQAAAMAIYRFRYF